MKIIFEYKDLILKVALSKNNTYIEDSYRVKSYSDMKAILGKLRIASIPRDAIQHRSMIGMINEWRTHNLLYTLGIAKSRTGSIDLNINQPWYIKALYTIISPFYLHFS